MIISETFRAGFCSVVNIKLSALRSPAMRRAPLRSCHTGNRVRPLSRNSFIASPAIASAEIVTTSAIGFVICRTVMFSRSSTRLIIPCSSVLKTCSDSCMAIRNSSRLPKRWPENFFPPVHFNNNRAHHSTTATMGRNPRCSALNGFANIRHKRFGYVRNNIFGSRSKNV